MIFPLANPRILQYLLYLVSVASVVIAVVASVAEAREGWRWSALPGTLIGFAAGGLLAWLARQVGDSFAEVGNGVLRVRMGRLFDQTVPLSQIREVREANHPLWGGLGIRTDFVGTVAVVTTAGKVAEVEFRGPQRLPVIPGVLKINAKRLRVSVADREGFIAALRRRVPELM